MGQSLSLFLFLSFQYTVDSKQMFNINNFFADYWIQTADLWYRKRTLYQLSHTPTAQGGATRLSVSIDFKWVSGCGPIVKMKKLACYSWQLLFHTSMIIFLY